MTPYREFRQSLVRSAAWAVAVGVMVGALMAMGSEPGRDPFERNVERIFGDDKLADIRVVFGYDDYKGFLVTKDTFRAHRLIRHLQIRSFTEVKPTEELAEELGVPADAQNLRIYEGDGKDGERLRVSLIWSSATTDSAKNSGSEYALQRRCSRQALDFMKKAASNAEVMAYIGHSRGGGGPDTYPPETKGVDADGFPLTDFSYYRRTQPGLDALRGDFSKSPHLPHIIAWTSCRSESHFSRWFGNVLSGKEHATSLILSTRLTSYMPINQEIRDQDEGLMAFVCLLHSLQYRQTKSVLEENLKLCEMEVEHNPRQAAWKLVALPSSNSKSN
ncbi:hypothetical protein FEM03_11235 [Phragmitibacter flavus]|uniref:Caspase family protein n=1 Tax=Phragmitibacter flavus TaxID=2576071 RepID=A0A5R8KF41_9BACT|nr:hypothetical protein [Phragmitibacter flavus]TLD70871.1 hypothetical protein FEM03_11235 [Phragmitibacter flavus]